MAPFPRTHLNKISENLKSHRANFDIKQLILFGGSELRNSLYIRNYLMKFS
jgi:hypothetical protein